MEIHTDDYEKLGSFYLGRGYDLKAGELEEELMLYDSKDLVTHGVVLGMTGSGKTGLCMALLEEAAIDGIPALVIDPKGDIANLMLTFPEFRGEDFRPWINEDDAIKKGKTPDEYAAGQAELWQSGLAKWGQDADRVRKLRECVDVNIFTPGSNAGLPVSILGSLDAPPFEVIDDAEAFADQIEGTVTGLLSLMGIEADPLQSHEHILMSNILAHRWRDEENLSIERLILDIQQPPFDKVGVLGLETFYPEKDRAKLALALNNLLASPGFATWLEGEPLDIKNMLRAPDGRPRVSIFSIAHLSDTERMFFVSLLLNSTLGWMRAQSGTSSLRALLYMDEIYGYLPPTANPPSKKPMMTMLKQARAFGLGVLLATQNPVDLDYKALSNIGTWFLGRLQTERDKMRVLDGLEGAAATGEGGFDRGAMEELLAGLGSRVFLVNNVHGDGPTTFHVRWVMSYLRGPLTRGQIRKLMRPRRDAAKAARREATPDAARAEPAEAPAPAAGPAAPAPAPERGGAKAAPAPGKAPDGGRPLVPASIKQFFLPLADARGASAELIYLPAVLRSAQIYISEPKLDLEGNHHRTEVVKIGGGDREVDFDQAVRLSPETARALVADPPVPGRFAELPGIALEEKNFEDWGDDYRDGLYREGAFDVFQSNAIGKCSRPGESERDFRVRLIDAAREERDRRVAALREKYAGKIEKLEGQLGRAVEHLEEQKAQAGAAKMQGAINIGSSILGALLGGRRRGVSMSRVRSGGSSASRLMKERRDVKNAEEKVEAVEAKIAEMELELKAEIDEARSAVDPMTEELERVRIKTLKKNIAVEACGIAWLPYYREGEFELEPAWDAAGAR